MCLLSSIHSELKSLFWTARFNAEDGFRHFDWGKLTDLPAFGSHLMPSAPQRPPMGPMGVATCSIHCPLCLSAVRGQIERSPDTTISQGTSSHGDFLSTPETLGKGWGWFEGQQLRPPSHRATDEEDVDWALRQKVCASTEMRVALWQWGAWTKFHSFLFFF